MRSVGYLVQHETGIEGEKGQFYDYILAGNGLFIENKGVFMDARVQIAGCHVRGLAEIAPSTYLKHGKIPGVLFDLAFNTSLTQKEKEVYFAVTWSGQDSKYHLFMSPQVGEAGQVKYHVLDNTVMDIHSHGRIPTYFSGTDDEDEKGFKLSCLVGDLDRTPRVAIRVGIYGYYGAVLWSDVFDGTLKGAIDVLQEEVTELIELQSESVDQKIYPGRSWWNGLFSLGRFMPSADRGKCTDHSHRP
jgi:PRTRC genetic system protein A